MKKICKCWKKDVPLHFVKIPMMKMYLRYIKTILLTSAAVMSLAPQCRQVSAEYIPAKPDYSDDALWTIAQNDSNDNGADVFYIVSTWETDWTTGKGQICHYADAYSEKHRQRMGIEINKVAKYMGEGNNFYSPFYRHSTIDGWITCSEDSIMARTQLSMGDVKRAFDNFQKRRDSSRPFILAGFSQGALAVVELLKYMDDETYGNMVAAYVMGYKVTPQDTAECKRLKAAKGEKDTGVTICYNTVKDVKYTKPVIAGTCFGINPVNWCTDTTTAILHDTISVSLDAKAHVLVVKNYSGSEYRPYRNFINVGDIHGCEPWLYSECLKRNFAVRTKEWRRTHRKK